MESNKQFNALLQVLSGEQQVIQRTDQKAFTLLSILGVFMVFFIVHFQKVQINFFVFTLMMIYFSSAMGTIYYLVRVIVPRITPHKTKIEDKSADPATCVENDDYEADNNARLSQAVSVLDQRSQEILKRRWLDDKKATLHQLADEFGVSAERIRQLEKNAMLKVRAAMEA